MEKHGDPSGNPPGYFDQGQPMNGAYPPPPQQYGYQPQQGFTYPNGQPQQPPFGPTNHVHVITQQPVTAAGGVSVGFDDHMMMSILSCIFCFWPLGLFAILKSCKARSAYDRGDVVSAGNNAKLARTLALVSVPIGVIMMLSFIIRFNGMVH